MTKRFSFILTVALLVMLSGLVFGIRQYRAVSKDISMSASPVASPSPSPFSSPTPIATSLPSPESTALVQSVHLKVPFTIQAPDQQWVEPWKEGCEEAALLMADAFNKGDRREVLSTAETKQQIAEMVEWQKTRFGGHLDLGIEDIAIIAKEYMNYERVTIKHSATLEDIRNELRRGQPVIVPALGRELKNPYFTQPGPPYHVFLVVGFEGNDFIVHENGTRQGRDYRYSAAVLEVALRDYQQDRLNYLVLEQ